MALVSSLRNFDTILDCEWESDVDDVDYDSYGEDGEYTSDSEFEQFYSKREP